MQTLEQATKNASHLYWLAYLLTGDRGQSLDVTLEALDSGNDRRPFSAWVQAWSLRVFIAKVLGRIRGELAESGCRTASRPTGQIALPPRNWSLDRGTTKAQLESALSAIDMFPRCALLLSIFERVPSEEVATLLEADLDLIRKAQSIAVHELTRNLGLQGAHPSLQEHIWGQPS